MLGIATNIQSKIDLFSHHEKFKQGTSLQVPISVTNAAKGSFNVADAK